MCDGKSVNLRKDLRNFAESRFKDYENFNKDLKDFKTCVNECYEVSDNELNRDVSEIIGNIINKIIVNCDIRLEYKPNMIEKITSISEKFADKCGKYVV